MRSETESPGGRPTDVSIMDVQFCEQCARRRRVHPVSQGWLLVYAACSGTGPHPTKGTAKARKDTGAVAREGDAEAPGAPWKFEEVRMVGSLIICASVVVHGITATPSPTHTGGYHETCESDGPHPTRTTCTSPGPCIPTNSDISISPERLGPVWKQTLAGNTPAASWAYFSMASGTVLRSRSTGTTAT